MNLKIITHFVTVKRCKNTLNHWNTNQGFSSILDVWRFVSLKSTQEVAHSQRPKPECI